MGAPVCIRHATTLEEASIVVAWLEEQGVDAKIMDPDSPGVMAFGFTDPVGISVFVADAETAKRAKELLEEHDRERAAAAPGEPVSPKCESCGATNHFGGDVRGTVQQCRSCGAYLDIP